jgi:hypothetical protein
VNGWLIPAATDGVAGVTAIDCSTAAVTVSVALPLTAPCVAETVDVPLVSVVASPALLTVATAAFVEAQVTRLVRFCVLASE